MFALRQVNHDGRAKPLTVGVSVHKDATISQLLEAVRQHPAAACSPEEELVLSHCGGVQKDNPFSRSFLLGDLSKKIGELQASWGCDKLPSGSMASCSCRQSIFHPGRLTAAGSHARLLETLLLLELEHLSPVVQQPNVEITLVVNMVANLEMGRGHFVAGRITVMNP